MKYSANPPGGMPLTIVYVKRQFILEFQLPRSEQQGIVELKEIKQRVGEPAWEYGQRFRDLMARLTLSIHDTH